MHNGFYKELTEFRKDDAEADFGFLDNIEIYKDGETALDYLHGLCNHFAFALHSKYGFAVEDVFIDGFFLVHSYAVTRIGEMDVYIDIRGATTDLEEFWAEFADDISYSNESGLYDAEGKEVTVSRWDSSALATDNMFYCVGKDELQTIFSFLDAYKRYYCPEYLEKDFRALKAKINAVHLKGGGKVMEDNKMQYVNDEPDRNDPMMQAMMNALSGNQNEKEEKARSERCLNNILAACKKKYDAQFEGKDHQEKSIAKDKDKGMERF